jgi:hypothetical protein
MDIRHPVVVGIQHLAARNMVAAEAATVAAVGTAVAAGTVAVGLHRFPVTRVDTAAPAAREISRVATQGGLNGLMIRPS